VALAYGWVTIVIFSMVKRAHSNRNKVAIKAPVKTQAGDGSTL
jgi:hypothetical protein